MSIWTSDIYRIYSDRKNWALKQTAQVHILPLLPPVVFAAMVPEMFPCLYFFIWKVGIMVYLPQRILRIEWDLSTKCLVVFAHSKSSYDNCYETAIQCTLVTLCPQSKFSGVHIVIFVFQMRKLKLSKCDLAESIKLLGGGDFWGTAFVCIYVIPLRLLGV